MDLATILGVIFGALMLVLSVLAGAGLDGAQGFVDYGSVAVVIGGGSCAVMVNFPFSQLKNTWAITRKTIFASPEPIDELIKNLVSYAETARKDGILSLENRMSEITDPFTINGLQMAIDGAEVDVIKTMMEAELDALEARHESGKAVFDSIGKYLPAFGMIGTLIGLVQMLQNLDDPSQIGIGMAIALLTTLYGAVAANLVALPMADKLAVRSAEEMLRKQIVLQGVIAIQNGDNPRIVEQKLKTFLPPAQRDLIGEG